MKSGPLLQSMQRLGMAAIAQAVKMTELIARQVDMREHKAVILDHMDRVQQCAIVYTMQFILSRGLGTVEHTRGLEEKLVANLSGTVEDSASLQEAVEELIKAAADYANRMMELVDHCATSETDPFDVRADGYEQVHKLARTAIVFTMQLTVAFSIDQTAARVNAQSLEHLLVTALDAAFLPPENVS